MMTQLTERRTQTFDARRLGVRDEAALTALLEHNEQNERNRQSGQMSRRQPLTPDYPTMLTRGWVWGDYAGLPDLQAATALLPLYSPAPLCVRLRNAGFGADGQGAVLTPLCLVEGYCQIRHFLRLTLRGGQEQYAPYHIWAVLPCREGGPARQNTEELCAQYLASGLNLRGFCAVGCGDPLLVFSARGLPRWEEPTRKLHLNDPELPKLLEHGYAAQDFSWDRKGMLLLLRPTTY